MYLKFGKVMYSITLRMNKKELVKKKIRKNTITCNHYTVYKKNYN